MRDADGQLRILDANLSALASADVDDLAAARAAARRVHALSVLAAGLVLGVPVAGAVAEETARDRMLARQGAARALRASRAWAQSPPTVLEPVRPPCRLGEACADLECPHHGSRLKKLARRAARALPATHDRSAAGDGAGVFVPTESERIRLGWPEGAVGKAQ